MVFLLLTEGREFSVEVTDVAFRVRHGGDGGGEVELSSIGMMLCMGVHVGRITFRGVYALFFLGAGRVGESVFLFSGRTGLVILVGSGEFLVGDTGVLADFAAVSGMKMDASFEIIFLGVY